MPIMKGGAGRLATGSILVLAGGLNTGCDSTLDIPVVHYNVRLEATASGTGHCSDSVDVAFDPIRISRQTADDRLQTGAFTFTAPGAGKPVEDGPGNYECWYEYRSPPLSPGKWQITGEFADGSKSCLREIARDAPAGVAIDQEDGCLELKAPAGAGSDHGHS